MWRWCACQARRTHRTKLKIRTPRTHAILAPDRWPSKRQIQPAYWELRLVRAGGKLRSGENLDPNAMCVERATSDERLLQPWQWFALPREEVVLVQKKKGSRTVSSSRAREQKAVAAGRPLTAQPGSLLPWFVCVRRTCNGFEATCGGPRDT